MVRISKILVCFNQLRKFCAPVERKRKRNVENKMEMVNGLCESELFSCEA
jgi:hypothetical protein